MGMNFCCFGFGSLFLYALYCLNKTLPSLPCSSFVGFGRSFALKFCETYEMAPWIVLSTRVPWYVPENLPSWRAMAKSPMNLIRRPWVKWSRNSSSIFLWEVILSINDLESAKEWRNEKCLLVHCHFYPRPERGRLIHHSSSQRTTGYIFDFIFHYSLCIASGDLEPDSGFYGTFCLPWSLIFSAILPSLSCSSLTGCSPQVPVF